MTAFWKLTFIGETPPNPAATNAALAAPASVSNGTATAVVTSLAKLLPGGTLTATVVDPTRILLTGTAFEVAEAKQVLAQLIDVPFSQVRVKTWSIQLNELRNRAADKVARMRTMQIGISEARLIEGTLTEDLGDWAAAQPIVGATPAVSDPILKFPFSRTDGAGWHRALAPLKLALVDNVIAEQLTTLVSEEASGRSMSSFQSPLRVGSIIKSLQARDIGLKKSGQLSEEQVKELDVLRTSILSSLGARATFSRYLAEREKHSPDSNREFLVSFVNLWSLIGSSSKALPDPGKAEELSFQIANTDKLLIGLTQEWNEDLADLVYGQVTAWAEDIIRSSPGGSNGIDVSESLGLAVTSGQPAALVATMSESRQFTPPSTLASTDIQNLLGLAGHTVAPGTAFLGLLAPATPATATVLSVAPGVSVGLIPTVLNNGSEARINMNFNSAVSTGTASASATNPVPDAINSLSMNTDVRVAADDLFEASTMEGQTTALGDFRWQIPVIDEIPLFGPMFRGPRRLDTKVHKAMVLINVGILPSCVSMMQTSLPTSIDTTAQQAAAATPPQTNPPAGGVTPPPPTPAVKKGL